ncbi:V-type ATPase 116kDa subunit family protein [Pedococcus sp. KACC 23699]|uniref:V-type ATPase 116kDa subunit family protein n=1 Tax=Pedococcus sp. KACC 23699 TaxID=3149228 RepID=A0AAU7JSL0_9MICO
MRWREALNPVVMQRVALLGPRADLRPLLVEVAASGTVQLDAPPLQGPDTAAGLRLLRLGRPSGLTPALTLLPPDLDDCERRGRLDLLSGEAQVQAATGAALTRGQVAALVGWMPSAELPTLADRLSAHGGALVPLPRPAGSQPPTLLATTGTGSDLAPLVDTYATTPYSDVNPTLLAALAYVVMFGMMFADAGQGLLLVIAALVVRSDRLPRLHQLRRVWLFLLGAGVMSTVFGVAFGEFFGPTGVLPALWLEPLEQPVELLVSGVAVGAVLLAGAYALGTVNRFREGGWRRAVYAPSGLAGAALFLGLALLAGGVGGDVTALVVGGAVVATAGLAAAYAGLLVAAGGGAGGAAQAAVELIDLVVRLGSNVVSFARLAAFGLTHAALGAVVWSATAALWHDGGLAIAAAVLVFLVGNAVTFTLEGLVAAIQALRLEYYELFSRVFDTEGVPFRPWHVPLTTEEI